ncbi:uncharacterized protein I206_100747 [Kwoniella pini CBS 10737]|uniref:Uncharacterized protein n=1 Tax=Kwoniella pini CBS 10737 TaxID=1296096 RepID=A0A1B9ICD2_9TREE|nr:uncharacterized protein I206_00580 [Kwoniella pini CBS 10737]OCF53279.1 hypothetical protein I206_00580 [Kwoniella pini CBS 10737]
MKLHFVLLSLLPAIAAQAQDVEWPSPTEGYDINAARELYSSQSAKLGGSSTTVIMGFPTAGATAPTDACDQSDDPVKRGVTQVGGGAFIAPTAGPYGMGK